MFLIIPQKSFLADINSRDGFERYAAFNARYNVPAGYALGIDDDAEDLIRFTDADEDIYSEHMPFTVTLDGFPLGRFDSKARAAEIANSIVDAYQQWRADFPRVLFHQFLVPET